MFDKGDVFNKSCNMELYLKTLLQCSVPQRVCIIESNNNQYFLFYRITISKQSLKKVDRPSL